MLRSTEKYTKNLPVNALFSTPKASVTITAYPTRGDSMSETPNHKAGMTVELKNGEDVIGTYTTGAQGQLLSGGSAVFLPIQGESISVYFGPIFYSEVKVVNIYYTFIFT